MRVQRTWNDNWNNVIRNKIFPDEELKDLMQIPTSDKNNIISFIEEYFIEDLMVDVVLKDEKVRVCYYGEEGVSFSNHIKKKYMSFDIYVKRTELYNVGNDALKSRAKEIAQKLKEILTDEKYVEHMQFTYVDDYNLGTRMTGYLRHHIVFSYIISH